MDIHIHMVRFKLHQFHVFKYSVFEVKEKCAVLSVLTLFKLQIVFVATIDLKKINIIKNEKKFSLKVR